MKKSLLSLIVIFLLPAMVFAGRMKGKIKDSVTQESLIGVNVYVKGTTIGTVTDINGNYDLKNIPAGAQTVVVSYLGYVKEEYPVNLEQKEELTYDFLLVSESFTMNDVVITGQAKGQLSAINQQMKSSSIVNIVSAEKIQDVPDANVTESVGRLPGISIQSADGEGSKVIVRGLDPRYSQITVNGVRAPSTSSNDNSVSMAGISPFMIDGIEVQKSLTPDKDADVVGAIVDLKLKDAEEGFHVNALVQNRFPSALKGNQFNPLATLQLSNRFFDNKLGVIIVGSYDKVNRISNRVDNSISNINKNTVDLGGAITRGNSTFTYGDIERERKGLSSYIDYKGKNTKVSFSAFINGLDDNATDRNVSIDQGGTLTKNLNIRELHTLSSIYSLSLEQNIGITNLKIGAAYNTSENKTPYQYNATSRLTWGAGDLDEYTYLTQGYNVSPYTIGNALAEAANDSSFYLSSLNSSYNKFNETDKMLSLDYEIPVKIIDNISGIIKVGGKYREKTRDYDAFSSGSSLTVGQGLENIVPRIRELNPELNFSDPYGLVSNNVGLPIYNEYDGFSESIIDGGYTLGGYLDPAVAVQIISRLDADGWKGNVAATNPSSRYGSDYSGSETTKALYAMADFNFTKYLKVVGGVRYEKIRTDYASWGILESTPLDTKLDTLKGEKGIGIRENDFLLPMVNAKIMPFNWMDIRFAYSQSIARPQYNSFMARYFLSFDGDLRNIGNPSLTPALSHNYDAYLSFNASKVGLLTIGGFIKRIEGFEYTRNFNNKNPLSVEKLKEILPYTFPKTYESMRSVAGISINNEYDSYVKGVELDWQTAFWYLPHPLNGITFSANYTYNVSEQTETRELVDSIIRDPRGFIIRTTYKDSVFTTPLVGQPKHIFNTSLGYDYQGFSLRVSYKRTAESFAGFIQARTQLSDDKRITAMYEQIDLSITQNIPWVKGLQVFLNASNLTNKISGSFAYTTEGTSVLGTSPEKSVAGNDSGKYTLNDQQYSNFFIAGLKYKF